MYHSAAYRLAIILSLRLWTASVSACVLCIMNALLTMTTNIHVDTCINGPNQRTVIWVVMWEWTVAWNCPDAGLEVSTSAFYRLLSENIVRYNTAWLVVKLLEHATNKHYVLLVEHRFTSLASVSCVHLCTPVLFVYTGFILRLFSFPANATWSRFKMFLSAYDRVNTDILESGP